MYFQNLKIFRSYYQKSDTNAKNNKCANEYPQIQRQIVIRNWSEETKGYRTIKVELNYQF